MTRPVLDLWARVLDAKGLRRARAAAAQGEVRLCAAEVVDSAARRYGRDLSKSMPLRVVPVSMVIDDHRGRNIRARVEELSAAIAFHACSEDGGREWLPAVQRPWRAEWQRLLAAHYYELCGPLAAFLASVERYYAVGEISAPVKIEIDLGDHPGADAVCRHAPGLLRLPAPVVLHGRSSAMLRAAFAELSRQIRRVARIQVKRLLNRQPFRGHPEVNIDAGGQGIVLVQYETMMMERLPLGATQDWIEASRLPMRRIVYYFNRVDSPLDDAIKDALARRGFGWVDYRDPADHVGDPDAMFVRNSKQILAALRAIRGRAAIARWLLFAQMLPQVESHREFMRTHRVVALHQHGEFGAGQTALNLACRQEDVAFVWGFWSAILFMSGSDQNAFVDLLFAWGSYDLGYCNTLSFDYRYAATCGGLGYDGRESTDPENAGTLRGQLTARPRFVVALFDSSHHPSAVHHSTENCALFYRVVLELVRDNRDWGCLIKSKGPAYESLPVQPGLQDVVTQLEAEGRCLRLPHATKPTLVGLASDAVACFGVNSAGIQSALGSGRPTLHFDPNNLTMHPLSVAGADGKVIFRDVAGFCAALRDVAAGDRAVGDLSPWAHLFDPFQDGMGRRRSGEVMRDYVAARDRGLSRDEALRAAAEGHVARYGAALATTRHVPHHGCGDQLWRTVRQRHYPGWPDDLPFTDGSRVLPIDTADDATAGDECLRGNANDVAGLIQAR